MWPASKRQNWVPVPEPPPPISGMATGWSEKQDCKQWRGNHPHSSWRCSIPGSSIHVFTWQQLRSLQVMSPQSAQLSRSTTLGQENQLLWSTSMCLLFALVTVGTRDLIQISFPVYRILSSWETSMPHDFWCYLYKCQGLLTYLFMCNRKAQKTWTHTHTQTHIIQRLFLTAELGDRAAKFFHLPNKTQLLHLQLSFP